jgi:ribose 5-phosphate isomerase B
MIVGVGSDHRGLEMKSQVIAVLKELGHNPQDCGAYDTTSVDYPDVARMVCDQVMSGEFERGILICGTGIGMSIAANKVNGIRAALCCDTFMAGRARQHNDANVMCIGAERTVGVADIVRVFMDTEFEGGRHQKRLEKIAEIEGC